MKRVVVLMSSQIAGKVFEKIRFDRSIKAVYYLYSQIFPTIGDTEQAVQATKVREKCLKKLEKADGIIAVVDNNSNEYNGIEDEINANAKNAIKFAVLFDQDTGSERVDGYYVISLVNNESIDPNLILNILHNGIVPRKHNWADSKRLLIKTVIPVLLFPLVYILIPLLNTGKIMPFWTTEYWWLPIVLGLPILWIVFAGSYNSACNRRKEFKREISRIEGYFSKTNPYSNSFGQHGCNQNDKDPKKRESEDQPLVELMIYNLRALYRNIQWGRKQAKIALVFGIVFSICGLIVYCLPLITHFKDINPNPDIASSVISPLVGGTIAELIAATAIVIYSRSIKQLNYYHKALHENERFLTSINIIRGLNCGESDRIAMIDKVVSDYIRGGMEEQRSAAKREDDD